LRSAPRSRRVVEQFIISRGDILSVYYKCNSCHQEHRSPAGFVDRASFDASPMPDSMLTCLETGRATKYVRRDMYWRDDAEQ
jgi:hypothetical protein